MAAARIDLIGIGIDIVDVPRVRRAIGMDPEFSSSWLNEVECEALRREGDAVILTAIYIAIKEAVVKAMGTGFSGDVSWHDITVSRAAEHGWCVSVVGASKHAADSLRISSWSVSEASSGDIAIAIAMALGTS